MFDPVAANDDIWAPDCPDALFVDIAAEARLSFGDRVLELGCGAGQVTAGLATLGAPVLALDPAAELIAQASRRLGGGADVEFAQSTFEAWPLQRAGFKLVVAAQAFRRIDPAVRFAKAANALSSQGLLAVIGNVPMPPPADFLHAAEPLFQRHAPHLWGPPPQAWYLPTGPLPDLFPTAQRFEPVIHRAYPYAHDHTPESFATLCRSLPTYQALDPVPRDALIGGLAGIIAARGGQFRADYQAHLYMAHRRG